MSNLSFVRQYLSEDVVWLITSILLPASIGVLGNLATPTVKNLYFNLSKKSIERKIISLEKELLHIENLSKSILLREMRRLMAMLLVFMALFISSSNVILISILNKPNDAYSSVVSKIITSIIVIYFFFWSFRFIGLNHMAMNYDKYSAIISSKINALRSKLQQ